MISLIKMEFLKLKRKNKVLAIIITCLAASATLIPMIYLNKSIKSWYEFNNIALQLINLIANIFLGIITGELYMDEYKNKTINVMFTYPISRTKIYFSKLCIILFYSFFIVLVGILIFTGMGSILNMIQPAINDTITPKIALNMFILFIVSGLINTMFSICYSFFSTVKRSVLLLVLSCILLSNVITHLQNYILISFALGLVLSFIVIPILYNWNNKDVLY